MDSLDSADLRRLSAYDVGVLLYLAVLVTLGIYAAVYHPEPFWNGFWSWFP